MLDLNITDYITVNFSGLSNIIDALGGIDLTINEEERQLINGYLTETRKVTGLDSEEITATGKVHLNGLQATAYCRNRYSPYTKEDGTLAYNDYARSERQRRVLMLIFEKLKNAGISDLLKVKGALMQEDNRFISTSMNLDKALSLLNSAMDITITGSEGFPTEYIEKDIVDCGFCVVANDLENNAVLAHNYLFEEEGYIPTETLLELSEILDDRQISLGKIY